MISSAKMSTLKEDVTTLFLKLVASPFTIQYFMYEIYPVDKNERKGYSLKIEEGRIVSSLPPYFFLLHGQ